jgi:hypothetical protein
MKTYKSVTTLAIVIIAVFFYTISTAEEPTPVNPPTISPDVCTIGQTTIGISFNDKGVSCANDTTLRLVNAGVLREMTNQERLFKVIFLPPYCLDYNPKAPDSVGISKGKLWRLPMPEDIIGVFEEAINYYFPEIATDRVLEEFMLISVSMKPSDADPKIAYWYFGCARRKELRPELLSKELFRKHGLVFMGMAIGATGEILSSGSQMYYLDEQLFKKLLDSSSSIEDLARKIRVMPPFFNNQQMGVTKKGPSPFIMGGMFKRAQRLCDNLGDIPLTAERFLSSKILVEGWLMTVVPNIK